MTHARSKQSTPQLSVRSGFARTRAANLAKVTGMTITQVVEDALRAYQPALRAGQTAGLIEKGGVLVIPRGKTKITQARVDADLDDIRSGSR